MSHVDGGGPLAAYNSLMDPHLCGYFADKKKRRHLRKAGLVNRRGEIVTENTYRLNMSRKEHKQHVKDLLAQAIVHKTLDMERTRQVQIKKKLEEIAKIELVRRVRADRGRKGDEDVLPYLSPRSTSSAKSSRPQTSKARGARGQKGEPYKRPDAALGFQEHPDSTRDRPVYIDADGFPVLSARDESPDNDDSRHLYALDQSALQHYALHLDEFEKGLSLSSSPYLTSQIPPGTKVPSPPRTARSAAQTRSASRRPKLQPLGQRGPTHLVKLETAKQHQGQVHTNCEVEMLYYGSTLQLAREILEDPRHEVTVEQQHCGGNTLTVFRGRLQPDQKFSFISRRHCGYPFSLTFYVNGIQDCRLSVCCEYKHAPGHRLGGKAGHFAITKIQGAQPCYKCKVDKQVKKKGKGDKKSGEDYEDDFDDEDNEEKVEDADKKDEKEDSEKDEKEAKKKDDKKKKKKDDSDSDSDSDSSSSSSSSSSSGSSSGGYSDDFEKDDGGNDKRGGGGGGKSDRDIIVEVQHSDDEREVAEKRVVEVDAVVDDVAPEAPREDDREKTDADDKFQKDAEDDDSKVDVVETANDEAMTTSDNEEEKAKADDGSDEELMAQSEVEFIPEHVAIQDKVVTVEVTRHVQVHEVTKGCMAKDEEPISIVAEEVKLMRKLSLEPEEELEKETLDEELKKDDPTKENREGKPSDNDDNISQSSDQSSASSLTYSSPSSSDSESDAEDDDLDGGELRSYEISVKTGDIPNSGTDSNVYIVIHGNSDKTGVIWLTKSETNFNKFERGKTDVFRVNAVDVGEEISKLRIGHDNSGVGCGWYVDEITIKQSPDGAAITFLANRWLDKAEGDKSIEADLEPSSQTKPTQNVSEKSECNDPDGITAEDTAQLNGTLMSDVGVEETLQHDGSIAHLLKDRKDLDVSNMDLNKQQVTELCKEITERNDVQSIVARNAKLDDLSMAELSEAIIKSPSNIVLLNLNLNKITGDGIAHVAAVLKHKPDIQVLLLHGNPIGDQGVKVIADTLQELTDERTLPDEPSSPAAATADPEDERINKAARDIATGAIDEALRSDSLRDIAEALRLLRLSELDIGDVGATNDGAGSVAALIAATPSLKTLNLTGNERVTAKGWLRVFTAIAESPNLRTVSLDYNRLGNGGAAILAGALAANAALSSLDLEGNQIGDAGAAKLLELVKMHPTLKDVTLAPGNNISDSLLEEIKNHLQNR
ncbi:uncharacterized protein LOC141909936 isoform X3 [Tubulanus polymorphus]|uniref:uncharacterized protein LOC141909936 isoform X3 n=1 Tax=Tubulanus polymorphus TaxID=672921 RepID=UPI003DA6AAD1